MTILRIVSWNIACGCDAYPECDSEGISETLISLRPDVVLLQEVDMATPRAQERDLPKEICKNLGPEWAFSFAPALPLGNGFYGNAVLSRFPLLQKEARNLGPTLANPDWEKENRSLAAALIEVDDRSLWCASTQLASNASKPSLYRKQQVEEILSFVKATNADAFVLGGDFNVYRQSPDLAALEEKFVGTDFGVTCSLLDEGAETFVWDIDRFYIDRSFPILATKKMGRKELSDHMLIMADIQTSPPSSSRDQKE